MAKCELCNGSGYLWINGIKTTCGKCDGGGIILKDTEIKRPCDTCRHKHLACGQNQKIVLCSNWEREIPITNEFWFCGLNTRDKAEAIFVIVDSVLKQIYGESVANKEEVIETVIMQWLKAEHKE